jgi:hypothetical protein
MEVTPNAGTGPAQRVVGKQVRTQSAKAAASDSTSFREVNAIQSALQQTPDIRSQVVQRARALTGGELTGGLRYPPLPTIQAISNLVAAKLNQHDTES